MQDKCRDSPSNGPERLPPLYARWMDELLQAPIPRERLATCHDCVMCAGNTWSHAKSPRPYHPGTKCCTYFPNLPNFLIGDILDDLDLAGSLVSTMVNNRRVAEEVVTPLGIRPPAKYSLVYSRNREAFGRDPSLKCPFLTGQDQPGGPYCGIWRHRNSVCATYFCKYVRGVVGKTFWSDLRRLLDKVEDTLRWWCVLELDVDASTLRQIEYRTVSRAGDLDEALSAEAYARLWGPWKGREATYFRESAKLARSLNWGDVQRIAGPGLELQARLVLESFRNLLFGGIPPRVKTAEFKVLEIGRVHALVASSSAVGPFEVPASLLRVLHYFDGRPTSEAIQAIATEEHMRVHPSLVRKLVDYALLKPCPAIAKGPGDGGVAGRGMEEVDGSRVDLT